MAEEPRYRLAAAAHISPAPGQRVQFLDAGAEIIHNGVPGWHMEPINDAARAAVKKTFPDGQVDPERSMLQNLVTQRFDANRQTV